MTGKTYVIAPNIDLIQFFKEKYKKNEKTKLKS